MQCAPVNLQDRRSPREYHVHCGDTTLYFKFGYRYDRAYLRQVFRKRLTSFEQDFFPGLLLSDPDGNIYRPKLSVVLEPYEEPPHDPA